MYQTTRPCRLCTFVGVFDSTALEESDTLVRENCCEHVEQGDERPYSVTGTSATSLILSRDLQLRDEGCSDFVGSSVKTG
jgi:hypothetical protein